MIIICGTGFHKDNFIQVSREIISRSGSMQVEMPTFCVAGILQWLFLGLVCTYVHAHTHAHTLLQWEEI